MNNTKEDGWRKEFDERFRLEDAASQGKGIGHGLNAELKSFIEKELLTAREEERASNSVPILLNGTQADYVEMGRIVALEEAAQLMAAKRDAFVVSTEFAVMAINQFGEAGRMAKQIRDLGRYQALDDAAQIIRSLKTK